MMTGDSMYLTLFDLAAFAMPQWLLLIFLPKWRVTKWLGRSAIVPAITSLIYLAGVGLLVTTYGAGFMSDFGSAEGVTRLLARQEIAMVAWIHILAFDQLVGLFIYRDNMEHRFVALPIQSAILFLTLMLGPIGFLVYYLLRLARMKRAGAESVQGFRPQFLAGRGIMPLVRLAYERMMRVRSLTIVSILGIAIGLFCVALILLRGTALVPPEGDLAKAATFDIALGIYGLTLVFFVPGARFTPLGERIWVGLTVVLLLWSFPVETIQIMRGIDPRFTRAGSAVDGMLGGVFFLTAVSLVVLFLIMSVKYFRKREDSGTALLLAVRYGFAGVFAGFAAGFWLTANEGSEVDPAGSILPLHALGFHGMQAIPAVALLLIWAGEGEAESKKWVHLAGIAWLLACGAVAAQTARGLAPMAMAPASIAAAAVLFLWAGVALFALMRWMSPKTTPAPIA
jgi:hypothetical protein